MNPQWAFSEFGRVETTASGEYAAGAGLPIARHDKEQMPLVHLDGSAEVMSIAELSRDMRNWSPFETSLQRTEAP